MIYRRITLLTLMFLFLLLSINYSNAQEIITFGPHETTIDGSIHYSIIGDYKAQFKVFKGRIIWDHGVQSVDLEIRVDSITSNCQWCDKIAKSHRFLNAGRFPKITFKSEQVLHDDKGFKVKGILQMHGIKREMIFPFNMEIMSDQRIGKRLLVLNGSWTINRKHFNIFWSKALDHGGILVGDNFIVNWQIKGHLNLRS